MKRNITTRQKVRRFKIIMTILAMMAAFIVVRNCSTTNTAPYEEEPVNDLMDRTLDSLLTEVAPEGYEIFMLGKPAVITQKTISPYRGRILKTEQEIATIRNLTGIPEEEKERIITELQEKLILYTEQAEHEENDPRLTMLIDSRRVRFRTRDGKEYACFQQHFHGIHKLKWLIEIQENNTEIETLIKEEIQ